jgi:hypothetical protein
VDLDMKEIEDLKTRLKNETSTRMEDRDIVDILEVLTRCRTRNSRLER